MSTQIQWGPGCQGYLLFEKISSTTTSKSKHIETSLINKQTKKSKSMTGVWTVKADKILRAI